MIIKASFHERNASNFKIYQPTFEKGFCVRPTDFSLLGVIFTLLNFFRFQTNLKIYSDNPDISFKFDSNKNIISKREN